MIKCNNLHKAYTKGVVALEDVSLEVMPGEIFGIIGTSGAGKSTLLRMINKLETPDSGQVIVNNRVMNSLNTAELKTARQEIGMIFQHFNLLNSLTVYDNIVFPLKINKQLGKHSRAEWVKKLQPIIELTGLSNQLDKYPQQLSGGQKQRVAIARSLVTEPKILLCDECTSSLDPETTLVILSLLKQINLELGVTIVLITHEMDVIKSICQKVAVMSHGRIVEQGSVLEIYSHAEQKITKKLLYRDLIKKLPKVILQNLVLPQDYIGEMQDAETKFPLLQLVFTNQSAAKPVLAEIMRKHEVDFNILQGDVETIQDAIVGRLIVQLESDQATFAVIEKSLQEHNINVEILGYVSRIY